MILALSGGTGGSKMVDGLAQVHGQAGLTAVVNTGDDGDFYGLRVCPDLDICTYVLAGVVDARGWGYADDSFRCLEGLATYGREAWFGLGDRDLATHIHRTLRLAEGAGLAQVTAEICARLGVEARVLPMTEDPLRTRITTAAGPRTFQEYLVRDGAADEIEAIEFEGASAARPPPVILALSGGTGGSKMVDGLAQVHGQPGLTAVVNTGDDGDFYGLRVCPDLDICTYVLAGVVDDRGWGYAGDTFRCLEGLATYGREAWFGLGDRDLATHIHRTLRLAEGAGLAQVTAEICARLGVEARVLP
ncbi:MAG TPA: 2-phospho-L-lactate transferase CofD family protein, partial [Actinomycetes bacterium]|nr:2-phospho-L-lactate transferase CofD family protein [Actinomycetes bacterium]